MSTIALIAPAGTMLVEMKERFSVEQRTLLSSNSNNVMQTN